ncbi:MAG TPA: heavy metal-binding domain-containing protein [Thermoanaerobaculia bacterium]|nr:heavy metal-binding domain-containing protein [Thermoanaerobaculia bacterium]
MKRYLGMNIMRGALLGLSLIAAACGGEKSVASKSAEAYREAQAKGIPVGGGHEHGGHDATATATGVDHSAHGATTDAHTGMDHGSSAASGTMDHSAHSATGSVDHAAMGHGTTGTGVMDHAAMGHVATSRTGATDHAAMGHGATPRAGATDHAAMGHRSTPRAGTTDHAAMGHGTTPTAAATDHAAMGHGTTPTAATTDHAAMGHGTTGTAGAPVIASAPRSNTEMQRVQPSATLRRDAFDAPAPVAVSEAAKAAQGGGHEGHQTRGITPGQDRENPPSPMPATRDGSTSNTSAATDHSQHGGAATRVAATIYTCPMHPEVTSDKPGTCSKCGMTLVKKK